MEQDGYHHTQGRVLRRLDPEQEDDLGGEQGDAEVDVDDVPLRGAVPLEEEQDQGQDHAEDGDGEPAISDEG